MESVNSTSLPYTYPPSPSTTRGETTPIDYSPALNKIVYCSANLVIIRDLQDLTVCETFNEHLAETTCARFSPNGSLICSGDVKGNIKIWLAKDDHQVKKAYDNFLGGRIRDISWTSDGQRLVAVGEGQSSLAKVILVDTGSNIGEITGHSKTILSCKFSPARPFKLITGSEDFNVNLYEGPPFKFKHSDIKSHKNFVTGVAFNPAGGSFVSVGSDKKIVIHDGASAQATDEIADAHQGTISACEFLNGENLVTASMDKTIKVWDLNKKECIKKLIVNAKPTVEDMQQGAVLIKDGICSLSLNGRLNIWKEPLTLQDESLPTETVIGHQAPISVLLYSDVVDAIMTGDKNGRTIVWKGRKGVIPEGSGHTKAISSAKLSASRKAAFILGAEGFLKLLDLDKALFFEELDLKTPVSSFAPSKQSGGTIYIGCAANKIIVYHYGKVRSEWALNYEPLLLEASFDDTRLFIGNKDGLINILNSQTGEVLKTLTHKAGFKLTALALSNGEDKYMVSGDSSKNIVLWNLADDTKITDDWVFHSASIQSLEFSKNNDKVVSTGFDNSVILWNVETQKKEFEVRHVHKGGVFRAAFLRDGVVATAGADNLIKEFAIGKQ